MTDEHNRLRGTARRPHKDRVKEIVSAWNGVPGGCGIGCVFNPARSNPAQHAISHHQKTADACNRNRECEPVYLHQSTENQSENVVPAKSLPGKRTPPYRSLRIRAAS